MTREAGEAILFALLSGYGAMLFTWWLVLRWKWSVFAEEARAICQEAYRDGREQGEKNSIAELVAERTRIQAEACERVKAAEDGARGVEAKFAEMLANLITVRIELKKTVAHRDALLEEKATRRRGWRCPVHGWLFATEACCVRGDDGTNNPKWPLTTHRACEKHGAHEVDEACEDAAITVFRCEAVQSGLRCESVRGHAGSHTTTSASRAIDEAAGQRCDAVGYFGRCVRQPHDERGGGHNFPGPLT